MHLTCCASAAKATTCGSHRAGPLSRLRPLRADERHGRESGWLVDLAASCEGIRTVGAALPAAVRALQLPCTNWRTASWTIKSPSVYPHRWVGHSGEHPGASDVDLRTSSAWRSTRSFRRHRQWTVNAPHASSHARCAGRSARLHVRVHDGSYGFLGLPSQRPEALSYRAGRLSTRSGSADGCRKAQESSRIAAVHDTAREPAFARTYLLQGGVIALLRA